MKCVAKDCDRDAAYKSLCLCQKHYFRQLRYGTTELTRSRKYRNIDPAGYVRLYEPSHPLANSQGYVAEHRKVVFEKIGFSLNKCEMCGKPESWETVHIDHIDQNTGNNDPINLRPLCRSCNVWRDYPEHHSMSHTMAISIGDVTLTPTEWARVTKGYLSGSTIRRRIRLGMTHEQALLEPKTTHHSKVGKHAPYDKEGLIEIAKHYRADVRKLLKEKE